MRMNPVEKAITGCLACAVVAYVGAEAPPTGLRKAATNTAASTYLTVRPRVLMAFPSTASKGFNASTSWNLIVSRPRFDPQPLARKHAQIV